MCARGRLVARGSCGGLSDGPPARALVSGKMLAGTGDCKTLFVEQALDFENSFDIFAAVEAMPAGTFYRLKSGEFRFPVTQDESFRGREAADFTNAEKALLRDRGRSLRGSGHGFRLS